VENNFSPHSSSRTNFIRDLASLSRFHIVLIATFGSLVFGWLITGDFRPFLALVVALDWFLVNIVNRVVDRTEDFENEIRATDLAQRNRSLILLLAVALYILSFSIHLFWRPELFWLRLVSHFLGLAYNFRLIPIGGGRRVRLKELYFFKNAASCGGFLLTLFAYPLAAYPLQEGIGLLYVALLAAYFAPLELSFEIIYDLRDVPGDRAAGIDSYPVVHGERWAGRLIILLNAASIYVILGAAAFGLFHWKEIILAVAPALQLWLFLRGQRRGFSPADCVRITWTFAAMNLGYCLWVLTGFPLTFPVTVTLPVIIEIGLVIIGLFCFRWLAGLYGTRRFLFAYAAVMAGSWLAEQTAIEFYAFYHYAPVWDFFIGHVPLAIVLIWPMVIFTTHHLVRRMGLSGWAAVGAGTASVIIEASLIEVVCANAGL